MSGAPDDELTKAFQELQKKMVDSRSRMQVADMQAGHRKKEIKRAELTVREITSMGDDTKMYRGVGRMFMQQSKGETIERMERETRENNEAINKCTKEKEYLERNYKESEESLRELLRNR